MVYNSILNIRKQNKKGLAILLDPDNFSAAYLNELFLFIKKENCKVDLVLVGGSLLINSDFEGFIALVKSHTQLPLVIFPGNNKQLSKDADAILFLSLISGRNPEYLIGQQVASAPLIRKMELEAISTGYILVGKEISTTAYVSNTLPIPSSKPDIVVATAIAGEMMGMKLIYLEAGSGAGIPVEPDLIEKVKKNITIPLIVGGGITNEETAKQIYNAGADLIVIGNALEKDFSVLKRISILTGE